ncbi:hypothetical protein, partial [Microbacterium lacticum]|uniref:hypothetical protein n=1 Tax=Microbacterium lacticum TaxID=33885 RepID=UPI001F5AD139
MPARAGADDCVLGEAAADGDEQVHRTAHDDAVEPGGQHPFGDHLGGGRDREVARAREAEVREPLTGVHEAVPHVL